MRVGGLQQESLVSDLYGPITIYEDLLGQMVEMNQLVDAKDVSELKGVPCAYLFPGDFVACGQFGPELCSPADFDSMRDEGQSHPGRDLLGGASGVW
jgi:hypothetical protein